MACRGIFVGRRFDGGSVLSEGRPIPNAERGKKLCQARVGDGGRGFGPENVEAISGHQQSSLPHELGQSILSRDAKDHGLSGLVSDLEFFEGDQGGLRIPEHAIPGGIQDHPI